MNAKSANSNGCTSNWTGDSSLLFPLLLPLLQNFS